MHEKSQTQNETSFTLKSMLIKVIRFKGSTSIEITNFKGLKVHVTGSRYEIKYYNSRDKSENWSVNKYLNELLRADTNEIME